MIASDLKPGSTADTLVVGAAVRTLDPAHPAAFAVAVRDGVVVGLDDAALAARGPATELVDLAGATLTPGLVDGHAHPVLGATAGEGLDLSAVTDLDGLRAALADARQTLGPGEWVRGFGLDHNAFGEHPIDRTLLDETLPGVPVFLRLYDSHSALASSEALRLAGVNGPRTFQQRASVVCDERGTPTGHLVEWAAIELVAAVMPAAPQDGVRARLLGVLQGMAATGITGVNVMDGDDAAFRMLADLESDTELPVRLRLAPWCMPEGDPDELLHLQGRGGRRWSVGAVKFFIDGTVEGGTAWLEHADCHGQSTEAFWIDSTEYTRAVRRFAAAGVQTATHAIGDAGVRHVVDSLAGADTGGVRHRIEHLETLPPDLVRRVVEAGLVASMQPSHSRFTKADQQDAWSVRLGPERAGRAWRCRDIRDAGGALVLGSDWPVASYDAREVLAHARLRRRPGTQDAPVAPNQALTGLMALEGMTTHAALADGETAIAGRIAVGYRADLTAFSVDPVDAPADEVGTAPIRFTMSGGLVTHRES